MTHKFVWDSGMAYIRCVITPKVRITTKAWAGSTKPLWVDAVGFVKVNADCYEGHIYGTVSPAPPKRFALLESAKAYVEEQALIGLTVNRLNV